VPHDVEVTADFLPVFYLITLHGGTLYSAGAPWWNILPRALKGKGIVHQEMSALFY